jgi:hydrogenase maturation protein HypF
VDAHPAYQSTQYGQELSKQLGIDYVSVQHHKAHFTAVLGEHKLFKNEAPILGVVWDGTGYGDDGQIWGGEFFVYDSHSLERVSHFEYFDWLAGDKMAKEPRLSVLALADDEMDVSQQFSNEELKIYRSLKEKNSLKTSSVGRLFDAVASLLNVCHINTYEGEAAMLLENYVVDYNLESCRCYCDLSEDGTVPTKTLLKNLSLDQKKGLAKTEIIVNFIYTLATLVFQVAAAQRITHIACSGGVFQNTMLIDMLKKMAKTEYTLYFNCNLSPNDEAISFGQIMYYLNIKNS